MGHYPDEPGWKEGGTSRDAAESMAMLSPTLRKLASRYIVKFPYPTAHEIAAALHQTPFTIRPRVSELRAMGLITNHGRGTNLSGKKAYRWRALGPVVENYNGEDLPKAQTMTIHISHQTRSI